MSKLDLRKFAHELNDKARSHPIHSLQEMRARVHGKHKAGHTIFSSQTIFKKWAFHHGGRSELQFNIGFDGTGGKELRSGVAFSFAPSRSFPNIEPLIDKARLFNDFLRMNPNLFRDMKMWSWRDGERTEFPVGPIPPELAAKDVFVFLGFRRPVSRLTHDTVLNDMDRLLPLYEYIESGGRTESFSSKKEKKFDFRSGKKAHLFKTKASYAEQILDVDLRHNFLMGVLVLRLKRRFGPNNVRTEVPSGLGNNSIDLVVRRPKGYWFYEIKTFTSPRACIREGLGQLLEYAFWPGCQEASRLIVVGESAPDNKVLKYCRRLSERFSLPIEYQQIAN